MGQKLRNYLGSEKYGRKFFFNGLNIFTPLLLTHPLNPYLLLAPQHFRVSSSKIHGLVRVLKLPGLHLSSGKMRDTKA